MIDLHHVLYAQIHAKGGHHQWLGGGYEGIAR